MSKEVSQRLQRMSAEFNAFSDRVFFSTHMTGIESLLLFLGGWKK
jgi:hypothetical protein